MIVGRLVPTVPPCSPVEAPARTNLSDDAVLNLRWKLCLRYGEEVIDNLFLDAPSLFCRANGNLVWNHKIGPDAIVSRLDDAVADYLADGEMSGTCCFGDEAVGPMRSCYLAARY